ncbi:uncharacterized protein BDV14DRAFT_177404 [Aspergillus stella-maris]|uniref:uncharacterized protein n=1 Tax=Aspergillus stella-maris TaxID=1810926 RepID=UPI003CCDF192
MEHVFNDPTGFEPFTEGDVPLDEIDLHVLDWLDGLECPFSRELPIEQLTHSTPILRVIDFPDRARPGGLLTEGLQWLVRQYGIPTALIEGETRSVTHGFGSLDTSDEYRCCWFNYLCKNITIAEIPGSGPVVSGPRTGRHNRQSDYTWVRSSFFLRWSLNPKASPEITLICFGEHGVMDRFQRLSYKAVKDGVVHDPLSLFALVLHDLSSWMDERAWDLASAFGGIEFRALALHRERETFTGLLNISKHMIYLQESSDAALETMKKLSHYHETLQSSGNDQKRAARVTKAAVTQVETEFQAIKLRLRSMDRRMQNVISLSFHLVTQEGNDVLRTDSSTMATIAFVTLVFLPITTVSTIFGSQFFNTAPDNTSIEVSKDFWIFWVISTPLTLAVLLGWTLWQKKGAIGERADWKRTLKSFLGRRDEVAELKQGH